MTLKKIITNPEDFTKKYCIVTILSNLITCILAVIYYFGVVDSILLFILGLSFSIMMFINLGMVVFSDKFIKRYKKGKLGRITTILTFLYLSYLAIGILSFVNLTGVIILLVFNRIIFFGLIGFSILLSYLNYSLFKVEDNVDIKEQGEVNLILKTLLLVACSLMFILCFFLAWATITGGPWWLGIVTGLIISVTSGLFMYSILATTILFNKLIPKKRYLKLKAVIVITGICFAGIYSLHFLSLPAVIYETDLQFEEHYGSGWNTFDPEVEKYFSDMPFEFGNYYFGDPPLTNENYNFEEDILYKQGPGFELRYDVYYPKNDDLLGADTTIIFIHGGSWCMGDKGASHAILSYFAAQGYYIYDIQYRLADVDYTKELTGLDIKFGDRDEDVAGDFTLEDMMEDIASFTVYLYENNDYGANLENTFFMGSSAGGHLAALSTFAYNEGIWDFSPRLSITGGIYIYPVNDVEHFIYEEGVFDSPGDILPEEKTPEEDPDLYGRYTPSEYVDEQDPPCILFHGTSDILVPFESSETIQGEMLEKNNIGILVKGYFGPHGHTTSMQHHSITRYYSERFLYLAQK